MALKSFIVQSPGGKTCLHKTSCAIWAKTQNLGTIDVLFDWFGLACFANK